MAFHNKQKKKARNAAIAIIGAILFIVLLYLTSAGQWIANKVFDTQFAFFSIAQNFSQKVEGKTINDYIFENNQIKLELADINYQLSQLELLKQENEELRQLSGYNEEVLFDKVITRVIGRDIDLPNSYILNKGSVHGIEVGNTVIVGNGNVVGRVISSDTYHSTFLLASDNQINYSVARLGETHPLGVSQGSFGLSILVDLIPQNEEIEDGSVIVTAGLEQGVPAGLVVGVVNRIISKENDLFKQASLLPLIDYDALTLVAVLIERND